MSEFEQTPPEGLWEALEASGAVGGKAGAAAGAGLLGKLLGGRFAPVWWSLAGVAAVVAAVLLLRTPGAETPVVEAAESAVVAEVVEEDASAEEVPVAETGLTGPVIESRTQKAPEMSTRESKTASPYTNEAGFVDGVEEPVAPAESVIVEEPAPAEPSAEPSADTPAEKSEEPAAEPSVEVVPAPAPASAPASGKTVVPLSRSIKRTRPLFAASFVGSGMPGSSATSTETVYGIAPAPRLASSSRRAMSLVSRNKPTEVETSQRIDYQLGLLFTLDITRHWGVESGFELTHLGSTKTSTSGSLATVTEESLEYVGIPLRVVYTPLRLAMFSAYISAGPELEYGISHIWNSFDNLSRTNADAPSGRDRPGDLILSASANAGVQVSPWSGGSFFIQPGVVYRKAAENSPESYYTDHPWSFRIAAGYRVIF